MFWRAWRLFAPDDSDGVDAKDICPSPNQLCLDDLEFVLRFSFNRRGDPVFALYRPPCHEWRAPAFAKPPQSRVPRARKENVRGNRSSPLTNILPYKQGHRYPILKTHPHFENIFTHKELLLLSSLMHGEWTSKFLQDVFATN